MAQNKVEVEEFETTDAGAAKTIPTQCSALRKNGYVVIKNRPCKIVEMSTSKTGKHGHAKIHLTALDIFNNRKLEDICPSTHNMLVPHVLRREYDCLDIDEDGFMDLIDQEGGCRQDLKINDLCNVKSVEEVKAMIKKIDTDSQVVQATVWSAMDEEIVKELKVMSNRS